MMFRLLCFVLVTITLFSCTSKIDENAVAYYNEDGTYTVNTKKTTAKILYDLRGTIKNFHVDTTEIVSVVPIGEKHDKVYFVQLTDRKKNQRLSRFLFLKDRNFYFFEDLKNDKPVADTIFYQSCYNVIGSKDNNCMPNIACIEKELYWITGDKLTCEIDSPCESQQCVNIQ